MKKLLILASLLLAGAAYAGEEIQGDFLIKFKPGRMQLMEFQALAQDDGGQIEALDSQWAHIKVAPTLLTDFNSNNFLEAVRQSPDVEYAQPNYRLKLIEDYQTQDSKIREIAQKMISGQVVEEFLPQGLFGSQQIFAAAPKWGKKDPAIPSAIVPTAYGKDPLLSHQWNMKSIHADEAWQKTKSNKNIIVAVIDTGVDYTHEDLVGNIWHSDKGEIGWDFVDNDNKPYDRAKGTWQLLLSGGNPGHGTHCAGNIAAVGNNSKGISGVAPGVSIMPVRFLSEKGQGTTAGAIKAINYAVEHGAKVLSNSWGSEGENPNDDNQALKDAITNAMNKDVLFVAAAGNGRKGRGYNNDTDPRPGMPASYDIANIISVAAIDKNDQLGKFSNYGLKTVHVGAPGVAVYSTTVGSKYSDTVANLGFQKINWDGTSMATPHVAGAAAMVWSAHPEYTFADVKRALLSTVDKLSSLDGKTVSGGKINVLRAIQ